MWLCISAIVSSMRTLNGVAHDKRHECYYCTHLVTNIGWHVQVVHREELEVKKAHAYPAKSAERYRELDKIRLLGDYHHNLKVTQCRTGTLIVVRRPGEHHVADPKAFLPCKFCFGFYHKHDLWRHGRHCHFATCSDPSPCYKEMYRGGQLMMQAAMYGAVSESLPPILNAMHNDDVGTAAKNDSLILLFGGVLADKMNRHSTAHVSQKMREISRLLIQLRKSTNLQNANLATFVSPAHFPSVLEAVRIECNFNPTSAVNLAGFKLPSLALKLGHSMKKVAILLRNEAIKCHNASQRADAEEFLLLHESEWCSRISALALRTIIHSRQNNQSLLPLTDDLCKIRQFHLRMMPQLVAELQESPNCETYTKLAQICLARLIIFNKRRGGEASRMEVMQYEAMKEWDGTDSAEIQATLSSVEVELCKRLHLVNITGKRDRTVPVILTPDVKNAIDILLSVRGLVGVNPANVYVFAVASPISHNSFRGWDCVHDSAIAAKVRKPELVTTRSLRKYVATVSQILDLSKNELEWLRNHLGHSKDVHKIFYRLQTLTLELAKVSKFLLAVDGGQFHLSSGKNLDTISLENIPDVTTESDDDEVSNDIDDACNSVINQASVPTTSDPYYFSEGDSDTEYEDNYNKKHRKSCAGEKPYKRSKARARCGDSDKDDSDVGGEDTDSDGGHNMNHSEKHPSENYNRRAKALPQCGDTDKHDSYVGDERTYFKDDGNKKHRENHSDEKPNSLAKKHALCGYTDEDDSDIEDDEISFKDYSKKRRQKCASKKPNTCGKAHAQYSDAGVPSKDISDIEDEEETKRPEKDSKKRARIDDDMVSGPKKCRQMTISAGKKPNTCAKTHAQCSDAYVPSKVSNDIEYEEETKRPERDSKKRAQIDDDMVSGPKKCRQMADRHAAKMPWSAAEKAAVMDGLREFIKKGNVPGKVQCEKVIAKSGHVLKNRSWRHVKFCIKNIIDSSQRALSKHK
jgi:hypothetical protein